MGKLAAVDQSLTASLLSPLQDAEAAVLVRRQSRTWCWCMCLGLALMLSGVVVAGAYLYQYYNLEVNTKHYSAAEVSQVRTQKDVGYWVFLAESCVFSSPHKVSMKFRCKDRSSDTTICPIIVYILGYSCWVWRLISSSHWARGGATQ